MPLGLQRLTGLETLDYFVVGKPRNTSTTLGVYGSYKVKSACSLAGLSLLDNLKGRLSIVVVDRSEDIVSDAKAANLDKKEITKLDIIFKGTSRLEDEMVLENLKPGAVITKLNVENYGGARLPCWMRDEIHLHLPNLVSIEIFGCKECIYMCSFGRLPNLQALSLDEMEKVEYIEDGISGNNNNDTDYPLFPSLHGLSLTRMPRLKGWWSVSVTKSARDHDHDQLLKRRRLAFPKLEAIGMEMELVISLAQVFLQGISSIRHLDVCPKTNVVVPFKRTPTPTPIIFLKNYFPMLRELWFADNHQMKLHPEQSRGMSSLEDLQITACQIFEEVPEWIDSFTSLKSLSVYECPRVKSLPHEISNLSNLRSLYLEECSWELAERCQEPHGEDWPKIQHIPYITIKPADNDDN